MAGGQTTASTETLVKDVSTAWQQVANLPFSAHGLRGIGLDNGQFLVTGEDLTFILHSPLLIHIMHALQVDIRPAPMYLYMTAKLTSGPQWAISPLGGAITVSAWCRRRQLTSVSEIPTKTLCF